MNFFKNLSISRFVISLYGLQVSRSLKTFKTIKSGLQCTTFLSQILCLQVSVLIIHVYCFLLSCPRAQLSKKFICIKQNAQLLSKNVRETCLYDLKTVVIFVTPLDCNTAMLRVYFSRKLFLCRTTDQEKSLNSLIKCK